MVKRPTELEEHRKLFGFKPPSHTKSKFTHDEIHTTLKFAAGSVFLISGRARKI